MIGRWQGDSGFLSGDLADVFKGGAGLLGGGQKLQIGDQEFMLMPDNSIINPLTGAVVGTMRDGEAFTLNGNRFADEFGDAKRFTQQPLVFSPQQSLQMQQILAARRQKMKEKMSASGNRLAKLTPDGRVLARAKAKVTKDFGSKSVSTWPVDMSRMILKDKAIPAVLSRSIDSRYMSVPVSAIVERHIYAEDGRNIIIPAGSKLIGRVTGSPGENRVAKVEISWERLVRPDGGSFTMQAVSGDAQGRGGVAGYLDEMFLARYGKPVLQSSVVSAISYLIASDETVTQNENYGTSSQSDRAQAAQQARQNFIDDMELIFNQMIEDSSAIPPIVFIPSGTRLTVFAMEDLWLRSEQDDEDDYVAQMGADSPVAQQAPTGYGLASRPVQGASLGTGGTKSIATSAGTGAVSSGMDMSDGEAYNPDYTDEDLGIAGEPIYENKSAGDSSTNNLTLEDVYQDPNIVEYPMSGQTNRIATPLQRKEGATAPSSRLF